MRVLGSTLLDPLPAGVALQRALKVLAKGLSMPLTHTRLWLLYLPLYTQHVLSTAPAKAVQLPGFGEKALESQQPSYRLWLAAAKVLSMRLALNVNAMSTMQHEASYRLGLAAAKESSIHAGAVPQQP